MKRRLLFLLIISIPALLIIFFAGLSSQKKGKESLKSVLEQFETATERFNQLEQRVVELSDQEEIEAGRKLASLTEERYDFIGDKDPRSSYIKAVGKHLAIFTRRKIPFHFYLLNTTEINAYGLMA